ncbi:MAG: alkaline phosphatase PhoX [Thiobacillus sp.]
MSHPTFSLSTIALALLAAGVSHAADFGAHTEQLLKAHSMQLFGIVQPLGESAPATTGAYRTESQKAADQVLLAKGLKAEYLTRNAADRTDMMDFYPLHNPTHLVTCVEGGRAQLVAGPSNVSNSTYEAGDKFNPSVQRIDLKTGAVETVLRGMQSCDGIRTTPWGTVLATEETTAGGAYEILNPLATTNYTVKDRTTGEIVNATGITDTDAIAKRPALPAMAWEGIGITPEGVVVAGDELRPGSYADSNNEFDTDGGAIFKFVPEFPATPGVLISSLSMSPLASGSVYAFQASCYGATSSNFPQFGQGCEIGDGGWVKVNAATARADADKYGATGYYRPEDGHLDPMYAGPGYKFCWANTGNESASNYGEVVCMIDRNPLGTGERSLTRGAITYTYLADNTAAGTTAGRGGAGYAYATANRVVEGDTDFNSFDNLAFQPGTGNLYVVEDHANGDVFACLPDGADRDLKSDGCVKILSVVPSEAEPTGFIFSPDGRTAYVSIQHTNDANMPKVDDYGTDDIVKITGFKLPKSDR